MDCVDLEVQLRREAEQARKGGLSRAEAMLICQAHSLQAIFTNMAKRAALNFGEYLNAAETYMWLALKEQPQCRNTLETLAQINYPRHAAFIKQKNNAQNQQVNN